MAYPNSEDYVRVVQRPDLAFRISALQGAVFATHALYGIPIPASGNAAVVFKAKVDGTDQALRFFIKEDASSSDRYNAIAAHFTAQGLLDCVASTVWVDDAIAVNQRRWPMVQMEWIEGRTLDAYIGHLAENADVGALHRLAGQWRAHIRRLQDAEYAHGDLQHGNVLIDTTSALRLVDFDGSWIAPFAGGPAPRETGHPNYQRTGRTWDRWMDTFPGLVIYTSLLGLSRRPDAWKQLHNGENMLFSHKDYAPPFRTRAWQLLSEIEDPEIQHVVGRLRDCCDPRWRASASLEELLGRPQVQVPPPPPPVDDPNRPWWERAATDAGLPLPPHPNLPPPPPRTGPPTAEPPQFAGAAPTAESWFARQEAAQTHPSGSSATWVSSGTRTPPIAPTPTPVPRPDSGRAKLVAAGIGTIGGLVLALLAGLVGAEGGGVALAFLMGGLITFVISLNVLTSRAR
jgi:eukaryotic-like serine/threonine-protein kinase